jgi:stage V sporulation protein B
MLVRTAMATAAGLCAATLMAALLVFRTARALVPPLTLLRVALGLGACVGASMLLPAGGKLMTLVYAAALAVLYLGVLLVTRELGRADLDLVRAVVRRKR